MRLSLSTSQTLRTSLMLFLLLVTTSVFANNSIAVGPAVGKIAPAISVSNSQQQAVTIKTLSGKNGLILVFFRSADWCPYCKRHLMEINDEQQKFSHLGYGLAAISYDNIHTLSKFANQQNIKFPLLTDQQAQTMIAYDIINTAYKKGDDNYGIPYPGIVVIDQKGKVTHKYFYQGYKNRINFSCLYQKLESSSLD